ncbi:hypothetical protein KUCAC02_033713, partial [Chaenocephalus aceratus]
CFPCSHADKKRRKHLFTSSCTPESRDNTYLSREEEGKTVSVLQSTQNKNYSPSLQREHRGGKARLHASHTKALQLCNREDFSQQICRFTNQPKKLFVRRVTGFGVMK